MFTFSLLLYLKLIRCVLRDWQGGWVCGRGGLNAYRHVCGNPLKKLPHDLYIYGWLGDEGDNTRVQKDPGSPLCFVSHFVVQKCALTIVWSTHNACLVQIVVRRLFGPTAWAVVLQLDQTPRSTVFDVQEALVRVRLRVGSADGLEFLRAHSGATLERECGQTPFHRHDEHVFAAVLATHMALGTVELVVGAAHKVGRLRLAVGLALGGRCAIGQRHGNDACAAGFLFEFAQ